jgi:N6-adenosine-specific RNA methylase IME4
MVDSWPGLSPPYATIVADPPWPYEDGATLGQRLSGKTAFLPYSTMSLADMVALPVASLGVCDAHLYLWATQRFLWEAPALLSSWGFVRSGLLIWCKPPTGSLLGPPFTPTPEFVLFAQQKWGDAIRQARLAAGCL